MGTRGEKGGSFTHGVSGKGKNRRERNAKKGGVGVLLWGKKCARGSWGNRGGRRG